MLKPKLSPWAKALAALVFALIWNGIISVFVVQVVKSWQQGRPEWGLTLFMIPFVLGGLVTIGATVYCFLGIFNPRPKLTVSSREIPLGETMDLEWKLSGRVQKIRRLRIYLEGKEEARYRRGTKTRTDTETFVTLNVADLTRTPQIRSGHTQVNLPGDTMHSFESPNNKIKWALRVHGEVDWWPDVNAAFPVVVLPKSK